MKRLTEKYDDGTYGIRRLTYFHEEKLGQLEDIEEELGADLVTVYKALKSPYLFLRAGKKIIDLSHSMKWLEMSANGNWYIAVTPRFEKEAKPIVLDLSLCGRTWSTKKEDLCNE